MICGVCGLDKKLATVNPPVCKTCYNRQWEAKNRRKADKLITCLECGLKFGRINLSHLKEHNLTAKTYKQKYPGAKTSEVPIGVQRLNGKDLISYQSKVGKICHIKNPDHWKMAQEGCKKWRINKPDEVCAAYERREKNNPQLREIRKEIRRKHPEHIPHMVRKRLEDMKKNKEKYDQIYLKRELDNPRLVEERRKAGLSCKEKHPEHLQKISQKGQEANLLRKNICYRGVYFDSYEEREIAKIVCPSPIKGVNCHIPLGSLTVDFFPEQKVFIEYHYLYSREKKRFETPEEYMAPRLKELRKSKYKNLRMVFIFDSIKRNKTKVLMKLKDIKEKYKLDSIKL